MQIKRFCSACQAPYTGMSNFLFIIETLIYESQERTESIYRLFICLFLTAFDFPVYEMGSCSCYGFWPSLITLRDLSVLKNCIICVRLWEDGAFCVPHTKLQLL